MGRDTLKENKRYELKFNSLSANSTKMVKHTQTIPWQQPTNCLSVIDHFVGLVLKELIVQETYFGPKGYGVNV